jgi:hypothetical protein
VVLELDGLTKRYGDLVALDGLTFSVGAVLPLAARIYRGGVLRTGAALKLRDAWRAARA